MVNRKIGIIVQAHMGSTRLPGKVMMDLCGHEVLWHVVQRLRKVKLADELIIATSDKDSDNVIEAFCHKNKVKYFRGEDADVLSRFYHAALRYELTDVVRICSDNTLLDWTIIDAEIRAYLAEKGAIVTSGESIPLGIGGEVFSFEALQEAYRNAHEFYQHEHVTPYIYENADICYQYEIEPVIQPYRLTLDTKEDWELIQKIYSCLYKGSNNFDIRVVDEVMKKNPTWKMINASVCQRTLKK